MSQYLESLNQAQQEAVLHKEGPMMIIAVQVQEKQES